MLKVRDQRSQMGVEMEVYLDNSATTKPFEQVVQKVTDVMRNDYGNPSSMHKKGVESEHHIKDAKSVIAKVLKVNEKEISLDEISKAQNKGLNYLVESLV